MPAPTKYPIGTKYGVPGRLWKAGHHTGVDYLTPTGSALTAPATSKIVEVSSAGLWGAAYGLHVVGECTIGGKTYRWITAHMSHTDVRVGQGVVAGQHLGLSGATGNVTGPHCHLELRESPFRYGDDVNPVLITAPRPKPAVTHRHVQANINQYMDPDKIKADVDEVLALGADTVNFNEAIKPTLTEIRKVAATKSLGVFAGPGALSQLVIVWNRLTQRNFATWSQRSIKGLKGVSPDRGNISIGNNPTEARKQTISVIASHKVSKAYSGGTARTTRMLKARWHIEYLASVARVRLQVARRDVVIFSEDANRRISAWPGSQPYPTLITSRWAKGLETAMVVHTGETFGNLVYDYVLVLSKKHDVTVAKARTVNLNSDHHAVVVDLEWS